eukprot:TRINITY_DN20757_c0_g1_i1.p1 TRINITY_DN20757_c0_g1~~TRINITY_DN20757_c0_g1_i1.p1  ORF type:complete len:601 (+),score=199.22 TRINITY_DN20757_c0_g1_i1:77-1804(+)
MAMLCPGAARGAVAAGGARCRGAVLRQRRRVAVRAQRHVDTTAPGSPMRVYHRMVANGELLSDPEQLRLLRRLEALHGHLGGESTSDGSADTVDAEAHPALLAEGLGASRGGLADTAARWLRGWASAPGAGGELVAADGALTVQPEKAGRGIYVHGDVGCGKTLLMDIFYRCVPAKRKRRIHLHAFMVETYQALHRIAGDVTEEKRQQRESAGGESDKQWWERWVQQRSDKGSENYDIVERYIEQLAEQHDLVCFDEFQVIDTADAAMISRLFGGLFRRGVTVVCTSNKSPQAFLNLGTQYEAFVSLILQQCEVVQLSRTFDYRAATGTPTPNVYLWPNDAEQMGRLRALFESVALAPVERGVQLCTMGRPIHVPYRAGGVALYRFEDLCGDATALGPADYHTLARQFHTVFIVGVPRMTILNRNAARRFITLIDELYQFKVKLVCTAHSPINNLFLYESLGREGSAEAGRQYDADSTAEGRGGVNDGVAGSTRPGDGMPRLAQLRFSGEEEVFAFRRVESRLQEMATNEYISLPHLEYMIDDADLSPLLGTALPRSPPQPGEEGGEAPFLAASC